MRQKNLTTDAFHFFLTDEFSQWYPSDFVDPRGRRFNCAEQWMMVSKAELFGDADAAARALAAKDPADHKAIGRSVKGFDPARWSAVALPTVAKGNLMKFSQNPELATILAATDRRILVEAASYDPVWGVGLKADDPDIQDPAKWKGTNWLGQAAMMTRDILAAHPQLVVVQQPMERKVFAFRDEAGQRDLRASGEQLARALGADPGFGSGALREALAKRRDAGEAVKFDFGPFAPEPLAADPVDLLAHGSLLGLWAPERSARLR